MASTRPLYTVQFVSAQNVPADSNVFCNLLGPFEPLTLVIRFTTYYWGGPSVGESNAVVLVDQIAASGEPTVDAFDSGVSESSNPILIQHAMSYVFQPLPASDVSISPFRVANISDTSSVDISVSGWVLGGTAPVVFEQYT